MLQFLMRPFKMKVRCATGTCLPSKAAHGRFLQELVGLLELKSLLMSESSFAKTKKALTAEKRSASSVIWPKKQPNSEKT